MTNVNNFFALEGNTTTKSMASSPTFSDPIELYGNYNFSLSGTFSATIHLQRSFLYASTRADATAEWRDVDSFTEAAELVGMEPEASVFYKFGIKAGNYTSGTAGGRLGQ